jgi:hypothetical protein
MKLSDLRREPTDEEKAKREEELRRLQTIIKGIHPDTGKRLRPGDRRTLRGAIEQMQFDTWLLTEQANALNPISAAAMASISHVHDMLTSPADRAMGYVNSNTSSLLDQARLAADPLHAAGIRSLAEKALTGLCANTDHLAALGANSVINDLAQRDPYYLAGVRSLAGEARAGLLGLEITLNSVRARLDPINDPGLISRLVGRVDPGLLHRATALAEPYAMQAIREQVNFAAMHRITDTWLDANALGMARASVASFAHDHSLMASEANRMLDIYGPAIAEQTAFLRQYETNLALFRSPAMLTPSAFERADLLARIVLPGPAIWDNGLYRDAFNPERLRQYGKALLKDLKAHYKHTKNPVHAWEAIATARAYSVRMPKWVLEYIGRVAVDIVEPDEVQSRETTRKKKESEAERIGKIAGYSGSGRGQTGMFKKAIMWKRDHTIYHDMLDQIEAGDKEDQAYNIVAKEHGISRSTVAKAFVRMRRYLEAADDQSDDGGDDPEVS